MIYDSGEGESLDTLTLRMLREAEVSSCLLKMQVEERERDILSVMIFQALQYDGVAGNGSAGRKEQ